MSGRYEEITVETFLSGDFDPGRWGDGVALSWDQRSDEDRALAAFVLRMRRAAGRTRCGGVVRSPIDFTTAEEVIGWFEEVNDRVGETIDRLSEVEQEYRQLQSDVAALRRVLGSES